MATLRHHAGALVRDWPRFIGTMASGWPRMHNRDERVTVDPLTRGVRCEWEFTSDLHIAKVHRFTGGWLLARALRDWPISFADAPAPAGAPAVAFILGHRGEARTPLLLQTLRTIAAQRGVAVECIVVEQSHSAALRLPAWVHHLHTPVEAHAPYNRGAAFNAGARAARAPLLVLHDNDMLAPSDYAAQLVRRRDAGAEFIDLKRFIFYLDENETRRVVDDGTLGRGTRPERVMQNAHGGSIAADRDAYFATGGFDEEFAGWGGEDNELWERAETRSAWSFGMLPFVHLWHAPQPEKASPDAAGLTRLREMTRVPPAERIQRLRQKGAK
jgi:hypothetical protein